MLLLFALSLVHGFEQVDVTQELRSNGIFRVENQICPEPELKRRSYSLYFNYSKDGA
jgi:hypothetical protein